MCFAFANQEICDAIKSFFFQNTCHYVFKQTNSKKFLMIFAQDEKKLITIAIIIITITFSTRLN